MVVNLDLPPGPLAPEDLEGGLGINIPEEEMCLLLMALADLALSLASLEIISFSMMGGSGGVSLALADCDLGLPSRVPGLPSRVLGLLLGSAMMLKEIFLASYFWKDQIQLQGSNLAGYPGQSPAECS